MPKSLNNSNPKLKKCSKISMLHANSPENPKITGTLKMRKNYMPKNGQKFAKRNRNNN